MGISRRIRRILKGYMKTARERLDELEAELNARRELEDFLETGTDSSATRPRKAGLPPTDTPVTSPSGGSTRAPQGHENAAWNTPPMSAELMAHFRLLGIPPNADLRQAREAYQQLMARANPGRFPEGSDDRRRAEQICQRIQRAYDAVRQYLDPTSARFDRLEI